MVVKAPESQRNSLLCCVKGFVETREAVLTDCLPHSTRTLTREATQSLKQRAEACRQTGESVTAESHFVVFYDCIMGTLQLSMLVGETVEEDLKRKEENDFTAWEDGILCVT